MEKARTYGEKIIVRGCTFIIPKGSIVIGIVTETKQYYELHLKPINWEERENE